MNNEIYDLVEEFQQEYEELQIEYGDFKLMLKDDYINDLDNLVKKFLEDTE